MPPAVADRARRSHIEHSRLYERELSRVRDAPAEPAAGPLPTLPGLEMAARYMPCGRAPRGATGTRNAARGRAHRPRHVDVVGHGLGAAALMGQLRTLCGVRARTAPPRVVGGPTGSSMSSSPADGHAALLIIEPTSRRSLRLLRPPACRSCSGRTARPPISRSPRTCRLRGRWQGLPEANGRSRAGLDTRDLHRRSRGGAGDVDRPGPRPPQEAVSPGRGTPDRVCDHILAKMLEHRAPMDDHRRARAAHHSLSRAERLH